MRSNNLLNDFFQNSILVNEYDYVYPEGKSNTITVIEQHRAAFNFRNLKKHPVEDASEEYKLTQFGFPLQLKN